MPKQYFVYILTNQNRTVLYIGITSDLAKRLFQHKTGLKGSFTTQYNCHVLIYYELFSEPRDAIAREKQLKGWTRQKKLSLIKKLNPSLKEVFPEI